MAVPYKRKSFFTLRPLNGPVFQLRFRFASINACPFYELSIGFHALIVTLQPILISEVMGSDCAYLVSVSDFKFTLEY